jgi:hypothetical protein
MAELTLRLRRVSTRQSTVAGFALPIAVWAVAIAVLLLTTPSLGRENDYQAAFYPAGRAVLQRESPYGAGIEQLDAKLGPHPPPAGQMAISTFIHPLPYGLMLAPMSLLPYPTAAVAYYWANLLALLVAALLIGIRLAPDRRRLLASGMVFAAFSGFAPLRTALLAGQADILILLLVSVALVVPVPSARRSSAAAGVLLGIASVIKIYPAGLVLLAAVQRRFQLVIAAIVTAAAATAAAALWVHPSALIDYLRVTSMASSPQIVANPFRFGLLAFGYRALTTTPYAVPIVHASPTLVKAAFAGLTVIVAAAMAAILIRRHGGERAAAVVTAITLCFFPFLEVQHLTILVPVLAVWLLAVARVGPAGSPLVAAAAATGLAALGLAAASLWIAGRPMVVLTLVATTLVLGGIVVAGRRDRDPLPDVAGRGLLSAAFLMLASPAFINMATWWGVPASPLHVIVGEGELLLVLALIGGLLLTNGLRPAPGAPVTP